ncbi:hypothetical protein AAFF_G00219950 [Aldrovandia affinis]|uniref:Ig-like domain-containing protein n=1 Tax=Aldrovandia affinis TaxID=143900 RepID=A0AAD7RG47_9TELE|nr:hypothetical protein AAFF_G00219950 [Aldrovandia affinis]
MVLWRIMHCALVGCCLLAMVNFSGSLMILQKPRFLGVKNQSPVPLYCMTPDWNKSAVIQWFKVLEYHMKKPKHSVVKSDRYKIIQMDELNTGMLKIMNVQPEDSGVYFCQLNGTWGPGTELQVFRKTNPEEAMRRSRLKDTIILIQALLLLAAVLAPLLLCLKQAEKEDAIYEEPEDEHTYEGLEIEQCGLYEDIPALHQDFEATWEKAESPCED